jgi:hypothetical protein
MFVCIVFSKFKDNIVSSNAKNVSGHNCARGGIDSRCQSTMLCHCLYRIMQYPHVGLQKGTRFL